MGEFVKIPSAIKNPYSQNMTQGTKTAYIQLIPGVVLDVTMNKDSFYLLQDAFVHIIRNSLDHGVEDPEERKKKGKSPKGVIQIDCNELDPENIEIKIKDDGKGINSEIIGSKAVEKGIHTSDEINKMNILNTFIKRQLWNEIDGENQSEIKSTKIFSLNLTL